MGVQRTYQFSSPRDGLRLLRLVGVDPSPVLHYGGEADERDVEEKGVDVGKGQGN